MKGWCERKSKGASLGMFWLFRKSILMRYYHHWLFCLFTVLASQYYINNTTFSLL